MQSEIKEKFWNGICDGGVKEGGGGQGWKFILKAEVAT